MKFPQPPKNELYTTFIDCKKIIHLLTSLTLGDPLSANLDLGLAEGLHHLISIASEEFRDLIWVGHVLKPRLLFSDSIL